MPPLRRTYLSQREQHTTCSVCGTKVIEFVEDGLTVRVDRAQAPITATPIEHHRAGRQVWRRNLSTGRWRYNPGSPRGENPVHLNHVCPTVGRS